MRLSNFFRTTYFQLALVYVVTFTASSLLVFGLLYLRLANYTTEEMRASLDLELYSLVEQAKGEDLARLADEVRERAGRSESSSSYYLLQSADGQRIAGNLKPIPPHTGAQEELVHPYDEGRDAPATPVLLRSQVLHNGALLAIGRDLADLTELDRFITRAFLLAGLVCGGVAVIGGAVMSSRFLNRIETIRQTSETIMRGNLSERIPVHGSKDELDRLAGTLNAMLDRIQSLMETTRQVSNDIAHDLRTPLTRLRHRLESVVVRGRTTADFETAVGTAVEDLDGILATFAALLRIAEVEAGSRVMAFRPVALSELMENLAETYGAVAEDAGQELVTDVQGGITVQGDRDMLTQLVSNLIENAIRHCPAGARIEFGLARRDGSVLLTVADNGPGIPAEERERVFTRFYRLERSRTTPGSGLGLAMVSAIAGLHHARVAIVDNAPGTRVTVTFSPDRIEERPAACSA